jgi:hypothetical protein
MVVQAGAEVDVPNVDGHTPLDLSKKNAHKSPISAKEIRYLLKGAPAHRRVNPPPTPPPGQTALTSVRPSTHRQWSLTGPRRVVDYGLTSARRVDGCSAISFGPSSPSVPLPPSPRMAIAAVGLVNLRPPGSLLLHRSAATIRAGHSVRLRAIGYFRTA